MKVNFTFVIEAVKFITLLNYSEWSRTNKSPCRTTVTVVCIGAVSYRATQTLPIQLGKVIGTGQLIYGLPTTIFFSHKSA